MSGAHDDHAGPVRPADSEAGSREPLGEPGGRQAHHERTDHPEPVEGQAHHDRAPAQTRVETGSPQAIPFRSLLAGAGVVAGGFLASRILGLARNVVIGHQYGASRDYEIFLVSIGLPDTVFQVLAGGAVSAAFIPVVAGYLARRELAEAWRLTSGLMNLAAVATAAVSGLLALAAPLLVGVLVPGWSADDQARATNLTRFLLVAPAVFAVSTLATSTLNAFQRFALAALAPLAYNLSLIAAALALREWGAEGLAVGAVVGAFLHLGVQLPGLAVLRMGYSPTLALDLRGTREVARLMIPRALGLGVSQLNQLIGIAIASFLVAGTIAYLNYAWLILMVPLGVFAMGLSTALFPTLAGQSAFERRDEQRETFVFAVRLILYATVPAAVGLVVLGEPIVAMLLQRGAFGPADTSATAFALAWFALGLPGHALVEIIDRVYYAQRDTATPVGVATLAAVLNVALSLALVRTPLSFGGLALANAVAALVEAGILGIVLHRRTGWMLSAAWLGFAGRIGLATAGMGVFAWASGRWIQPLLQATVGPVEVALVATVALAAAGLYAVISYALGLDEPRQLASLLRKA